MLASLAVLKYLQFLVFSGLFFIRTLWQFSVLAREAESPALSIYLVLFRRTSTWYTEAILATLCNSLHSCSHTLCAAPRPMDVTHHWINSVGAEHTHWHTYRSLIWGVKDIALYASVLLLVLWNLTHLKYLTAKPLTVCPIKQSTPWKEIKMQFIHNLTCFCSKSN